MMLTDFTALPPVYEDVDLVFQFDVWTGRDIDYDRQQVVLEFHHPWMLGAAISKMTRLIQQAKLPLKFARWECSSHRSKYSGRWIGCLAVNFDRTAMVF